MGSSQEKEQGVERLGRWCYNKRKFVVLAWAGTLVLTGVLALISNGEFTTNFKLPASESQQSIDLLQERFRAFSGSTADITFATKSPQKITDPGIRARMERMFSEVNRLPHVSDLRSPYLLPPQFATSSDGTVAFAAVQFDVQGPDVPKSTIDAMKELALEADGDDLQVELGGVVVQFIEQTSSAKDSGSGLILAAVILLLTFGSVVAMGLPLMTALFALGVGMALITLSLVFIDIPFMVTEMASMIGIGVGIDYALFIVTRYRQGLHAGLDPEEATVTSINTSGRAVVFAGTIVIISLLGMLLMGLPFVRGLAMATAVVVLLTILTSITLLPAVLGFVGNNIDRLHIPGLRADESAHRESRWFRWSRFIQHHPWLGASVGLVILLVLSIPSLSIRLGSADAGNDPTSMTSRRSYDLLDKAFGPGRNGPLLLTAVLPGAGDATEELRNMKVMGSLAKTIEAEDNVNSVMPVIPNESKDTAIIIVYPETSPQAEETEALIKRLRNEVIPASLEGTDIKVYVGGVTALFTDMGDQLAKRLPLFIGAVMALSFILLMIVFRSLLVPLKAAVMNLLSISAAYGVVVAVFQWGWGKDLIGIDRVGPIESFAPMMMFAVLFGLSMDYEVFLLSRVREEWLRTNDNAVSVADGLATTAKVITAAAAIMITVFGSFVLGDNRLIKLFGLGLASAIFIDATIVRMLLVPSTMELLGPANWWLPRWLDRMLPTLSIEGEDEALTHLLDDIDADLEDEIDLALQEQHAEEAGSHR